MLVVGCIPNFSSERLVSRVAVLARLEFWLAFVVSLLFFHSPMPFAYV